MKHRRLLRLLSFLDSRPRIFLGSNPKCYWIISAFLVASLVILQSSPVMAKTICSITINSSNEKQTFQNRIKQTDPQTQFVELTSKGNRENWLQKACESGVQCDSLIISGHFAWAFFSEKANGYQMTSEEMQTASCSRKCQGIFSQPKEIFLFGCNTLASPTPDHRTPAEYKKVLLESGFTDQTADMVVACRYKNIGCSSAERMRKIFTGVPLIYGFDSTSPLGAQNVNSVNQMLSRSLQKDGNYTNHLNRLEAAKTMGTIQQMNQMLSGYRSDWSTSFAGQATASCSGNKDLNRDECVLSSPNSTQTEKLLAAERLMNSPNRRQHYFELQKFISEIDPVTLSDTDKNIILRIKNNPQAESDFRSIYGQINNLPYLKMRMSSLGRRLGWLTEAQYQSDVNQFMSKYNSKGSISQQDFFDISSVGPMDIKLANTNTSLLSSSYGVDMVGETRTSDPAFSDYLYNRAKTSSALQDNQLSALAKLRTPTDKNIIYFRSMLSDQSNPELQYKALVFSPLLPFDQTVGKEVYSLTSSANSRIKSQAWSALNTMSQEQPAFSNSVEIKNLLIDRYLAPSSSYFDKSDAAKILHRMNLSNNELQRLRTANPNF